MPGIRIIAGKAKGRKLKMVPGTTTRPIGDRVKQAMFNILGPDVVGVRFLDLYAGTGSVGIEALSRGAESCTFVDLDRVAVQTIHENLAHCGFTDSGEVLQREVLSYLERPASKPFDIAFIAPPQYQDLWHKTLQSLDKNSAWIIPDGIVIVQIDPSEYSPQELQSFVLYDERKYGNTKLLFYEFPGE